MHVEGRVDPKADIETINTELILADLQTLDSAIPASRRRSRAEARPSVLAARQGGKGGLPEGHHTLRGIRRP